MEDFKSLQKKAMKEVSKTEIFQYKTLPRRIGSGFIDYSIVSIIAIVAIFVFKEINIEGKYLFLMVTFQISFIIYNILFVYFLGTTPGKMIFRLKVISITERPNISLNTAILRELIDCINLGMYSFLIYQFSIQGILLESDLIHSNNFKNQTFDSIMQISLLISISEIATAIFSKKRRSIHDLIANTIVVKEEIDNKVKPAIAIAISLIILIMYFKAYNYLFQ